MRSEGDDTRGTNLPYRVSVGAVSATHDAQAGRSTPPHVPPAGPAHPARGPAIHPGRTCSRERLCSLSPVQVVLETHFASLEEPSPDEGFSRVDVLEFTFEPARAEETLALQSSFLEAG